MQGLVNAAVVVIAVVIPSLNPELLEKFVHCVPFKKTGCLHAN
jgi:hypothetical protein